MGWEGKDISKKTWFAKVLVQLLLKFVIKKLGTYVCIFFLSVSRGRGDYIQDFLTVLQFTLQN